MRPLDFQIFIRLSITLRHKRIEAGVYCCLLFLAITQPALAQQEPQFTNYMFNSLVYNPGYAGSKAYLSAVVIMRDQWLGWGSKSGKYDGRPQTQSFSVHSTVNKNVGLGLNVVRDQIGAKKTTLVNACYAYRVAFGKGTLSLGVLAGMMNWRADWDLLDFKDARELDLAFDGPEPSVWLPDFGAGIYYYTSRFYAGISIPHLGQFDLRRVNSAEQDVIRKWAKVYRHTYLTAGGAIPLKEGNIVLKPSLLVKSVGFFSEFFKQGSLVREIGAPAAFDIDMSALFQEKLWAGVAFRSAFAAFSSKNNHVKSSYDSLDLWFAFYLRNGLRLGMAYDYSLGKMQSYTRGSFELMLGYDFYRQIDKANSPRYF
jgi:type IX secretion system PorP/SprF family membrane protein